jgi:hypothetical protein
VKKLGWNVYCIKNRPMRCIVSTALLAIAIPLLLILILLEAAWEGCRTFYGTASYRVSDIMEDVIKPFLRSMRPTQPLA